MASKWSATAIALYASIALLCAYCFGASLVVLLRRRRHLELVKLLVTIVEALRLCGVPFTFTWDTLYAVTRDGSMDDLSRELDLVVFVDDANARFDDAVACLRDRLATKRVKVQVRTVNGFRYVRVTPTNSWKGLRAVAMIQPAVWNDALGGWARVDALAHRGVIRSRVLTPKVVHDVVTSVPENTDAVLRDLYRTTPRGEGPSSGRDADIMTAAQRRRLKASRFDTF